MTLHRGDERFALEGEWSDDWLAALAAFLDCNFEPHDALTLALAWRAGDENKADAWPVDFATFPRVADLPPAPDGGFPACPDHLGLYPVLPSADWMERVLDLGVRTAQLRRKSDRRRPILSAKSLARSRRGVGMTRSFSSTITGARRSRRARTASISARKTCRPPI